jgi:hypothetical protein
MKLPARLATSAIALALALVPLSAAAPATADDTGDTATYEIWFDGSCDGMAITVPSRGLGQPGTADAERIGCNDGPLFGTAAPKGESYDVEQGTEYLTDDFSETLWVIRPNHTFTIYSLSLGYINEGFDGTWSLDPPPLDSRTSVSSTDAFAEARAEAAAAGVGASAGSDAAKPKVKTFALIDRCFDITLATPSGGTGEKGTVDGNMYGCERGGVFGAYDNIAGKKNTYVVQYYSSDRGEYVQTVIFPDKTWVSYSLDDDWAIMIEDQGTWKKA